MPPSPDFPIYVPPLMFHQALLAHVAYARDAAKRAAAAGDCILYYNQHLYLVINRLCPHVFLSISISLDMCSFLSVTETPAPPSISLRLLSGSLSIRQTGTRNNAGLDACPSHQPRRGCYSL